MEPSSQTNSLAHGLGQLRLGEEAPTKITEATDEAPTINMGQAKIKRTARNKGKPTTDTTDVTSNMTSPTTGVTNAGTMRDTSDIMSAMTDGTTDGMTSGMTDDTTEVIYDSRSRTPAKVTAQVTQGTQDIQTLQPTHKPRYNLRSATKSITTDSPDPKTSTTDSRPGRKVDIPVRTSYIRAHLRAKGNNSTGSRTTTSSKGMCHPNPISSRLIRSMAT